MCAATVGEEHSHVVDLDSRELLCTCRPCALLFTAEGAGRGRYRAVPEHYRSFGSFSLRPEQWDDLQIPVQLAFLFVNSRLGRTVAFYPSPAGATESLLPLHAWDEIVAANPELGRLQPDVEALLIRNRPEGAEAYLVPIDACYQLVGHLRLLWRGFEGGREAHERIEQFFANVRGRSRLGSAR
jgi:hypothetical protein